MESIPTTCIFEFNPDTLQYLRKQYDLDKPGRIEEAIDLLEEWIKKQNHFKVKDFSRDYLERSIIISKGSVERAKAKLNKICTFRTIFPYYFGAYDVKKSLLLVDMYGIFLPKLTKDHYRVYFFKNKAEVIKTGYLDHYRYFFMQCEYIQAHDYCNGIVIVIDYTEANILETVKWFNLAQFRDALMVLREGYGMRIKGIHFISGSRAIDAVVRIFRQALSAKVAKRICVHKDVDSIFEFIDKDIVPVEYGGKEKPLFELHNMIQAILTSHNFTIYLEEMSKACTDENLRLSDTQADQYLGIPGSFRALSVD